MSQIHPLILSHAHSSLMIQIHSSWFILTHHHELGSLHLERAGSLLAVAPVPVASRWKAASHVHTYFCVISQSCHTSLLVADGWQLLTIPIDDICSSIDAASISFLLFLCLSPSQEATSINHSLYLLQEAIRLSVCCACNQTVCLLRVVRTFLRICRLALTSRVRDEHHSRRPNYSGGLVDLVVTVLLLYDQFGWWRVHQGRILKIKKPYSSRFYCTSTTYAMLMEYST